MYKKALIPDNYKCKKSFRETNINVDLLIGYDIDWENYYYLTHCKICNTKIRMTPNELLYPDKEKWCICYNKEGQIVNNTYGRIRVLERRHKYSKYYLCECLICGNRRFLSEEEIKVGKMSDCDCNLPSLYVHDLVALGYDVGFEDNYIPKRMDYINIGEVYGNLTVLSKDLTRNRAHYFCRCNKCNGVVSIRSDHIRSGSTNRCNCSGIKKVMYEEPEIPIEFS